MTTKNITEQQSLDDLAFQIHESVIKLKGSVSSERRHSIESHIRLSINRLGYRVSETAEKKATLCELAEQLCHAENVTRNNVPEQDYDYIHQHLATTLSNLKGEEAGTMGPSLKDLPPLKEVPARSNARADENKAAGAEGETGHA